MKFGNLHFLWMLWFIPIVIFFSYWAMKRNRQLLRQFVSDELRDRLLENFSPKRKMAKIILTLLAFTLMVFALIRPKWGFHWEEVKRRGVDMMIALDVSKSMLAEDVSPNRLERAKREIKDLLKIVEGDRVGLIAFSGTSFIQAPLTLDHGAVHLFLDDINTDFIPVPGTALGKAISQATEAFDAGDKKSRVLILITDGEDHLGNPVESAQKAAQEGIKIYTIGIGKEGGAPIPDKEKGGFKKNRRGEVILTKLDEDTLQKIALETGGSYVRSITGDLDLERIYGDIRESVEEKDLQSGKRKRFEERYQGFLLLAFLLLFFEPFISEGRRGRRKVLGKLFSLALIFFGLHIPTPKAKVFSSPQHKGVDQYQSQNYSEALKELLDAQIEAPNDLSLKYNLANTYYQLKEYDKAQKLFQSTALEGDLPLSQKSYYNLGNTAYRLGKLQEAIAHYEKALDIDPKDEDAQFNLKFIREEIKRRMEEQKKRQQQQKQKQQQQAEQDKQQDQKEQQQQAGQSQNQDKERDQKEKEKEEEQQQTGQNQNSPQQQQQQAQGANPKEQSQISEEEAQRWLSILKERRESAQEKNQGRPQHYQVEKDW